MLDRPYQLGTPRREGSGRMPPSRVQAAASAVAPALACAAWSVARQGQKGRSGRKGRGGSSRLTESHATGGMQSKIPTTGIAMSDGICPTIWFFPAVHGKKESSLRQV